ncbi:MAG: hypothetical protein ACRDIC_23935, partial [bacterium]
MGRPEIVAPGGAQALARRVRIPRSPQRRRTGHHRSPIFTKEERMLNAPTLEQLQALKLSAMAMAWTEQQQQADMTALAF